MAEVAAEGQDYVGIVDEYIKTKPVLIFSISTCPRCEEVKQLFRSLNVGYYAVELDQLTNGQDLQKVLAEKMGKSDTVPQVYIDGNLVGGCDDVVAAYRTQKLQEMLTSYIGKIMEWFSYTTYEYDLVIVGGGSGGLAAAKEAAKFGKKVAVIDYVQPTPHGATWGLGGTCVNVGCIPKKLMHQAAMLKMAVSDAPSYGWKISGKVDHSWALMREAVQDYIASLNWNYKVQLRSADVKYINAYASFVDPHKLKLIDKKQKEAFITSNNFIIATGERPKYPQIEGAKEYGITSDDLFSLKHSPGKTLVVGASYVALECAGFLVGIGLDVTVMVRSVLLRSFDQGMAERLGGFLKSYGVKFIRPCIPKRVESTEGGKKLKVVAQMSTGQEITDTYDTVLFATGREPCTRDIGLEEIGVCINPANRKIPAINEQSNIPHIYVVGDVLDGKRELTPVAIKAGTLLARRILGESETLCDYLCIPTTIFTPLEYGCIGYSEENATELFEAENIEVYHSSFTPLEWAIVKRHENVCYAKVVVLKPDNGRVIGFHYLGPNAGEVTQGFALAMKKGANKKDLDAVIGIHPTCAEEFTKLRITKSSGAPTAQTGC